MSLMLTAEVWLSYPSGGDELVLALALSDRTNHDGTFTLGDQSYLSCRCRMGLGQLNELIADMIDRGRIVPSDEVDGAYYLNFRY